MLRRSKTLKELELAIIYAEDGALGTALAHVEHARAGLLEELRVRDVVLVEELEKMKLPRSFKRTPKRRS